MSWARKSRPDRDYQEDPSAEGRDKPLPRAPGKRTLVGNRGVPRRLRRALDELLLRAEEQDAAGHRDERGVRAGAGELVERAESSQGQPLPRPVKDQFEASLGADLSRVRVHTGDRSAAAADAVGAKAYTVGEDIHFSAGRYNPSGAEGLRLLAHEVAHTVQQDGGPPVRQNELEVSAPGDAAEVEADRAAEAMVRAAPARVSTGRATLARDPEGGGGSAVTHAGSLALGEKEIAEGKLGEYFYWTAKVGGSIEYKELGSKAAEGSDSEEPSGPQAKVGVKTTAKGGVGVAGGVEQKLEEWSLGELGKVQPSIQGWGFELTEDGVKATGPGFTLSTPEGTPVKVDVKVLEFVFADWPVGEPPTIAALDTEAAVTIPLGHLPLGDSTYEVGVKGALTLRFEPNYTKLGRWIAQEAAKMLSAEMAVVGGIVAGGVMTLWAAAYQIANAGEIAKDVDAAVNRCKEYAMGFEAGVRGESASLGSDGQRGVEEGKAWAKERETIANASGGSVAEAAKKVDIYGEAWNSAWPQIRQQAVDAYWEEHGFEHWITDGEGMGSGGFKTFEMVLDAAGSRVRR